MYLAGEAGVIDINGTVVVELITFLVMLAILARWVYPEVVRLAEARQRAVAEQLREAERAKADAETRLKEAQAQLDDARKTAQDLIDAANRSGQQARQDLRQKAEEEARRIAESARKEIDEKVIGERLDDAKHRRLIENAIQEVASADGGR